MTYEFAEKIQIGDEVIVGDTGLHAIVQNKFKGLQWTGKGHIPIVEFEVLYECLGEKEFVTNNDLEGADIY
jgi:hypothetical protein